ncbi:hypothetical protein CoNPh17_CDS0039 [Staphylococcus phage S-CoN_Ph17]|nr:hypothetical protein CoNPh17_CDS0039 [Staphylococcus phage S-CoN_Ph17]
MNLCTYSILKIYGINMALLLMKLIWKNGTINN